MRKIGNGVCNGVMFIMVIGIWVICIMVFGSRCIGIIDWVLSNGGSCGEIIIVCYVGGFIEVCMDI